MIVSARGPCSIFVYAVGAAIAECEQARGPVQPSTLRESLLLQISEISTRLDLLEPHDVAGLSDLRRRMIQMADDPKVRDRFRRS